MSTQREQLREMLSRVAATSGFEFETHDHGLRLTFARQPACQPERVVDLFFDATGALACVRTRVF